MTTHTQDIVAVEDRFQIPTYTKMALAAERGDGPWLHDADGKRYLDLYGGHCVAALGHSHPGLQAALKRQVDRLLFYSNAVYSPVRARAARALAELAPDGLRHVFFCNSGTEANETALKLARKATGRPTVVAMESGFHGRTLGSLAATWSARYRSPYLAALGPVEFVPFGDAAAARAVLGDRRDVAAVILEPIQSMAGIVEASPAYFRELADACREHGAMLVFDEIQTGVGRTGTFSISESIGVRPDLITLAKSLGGGVPVGAVLVSDEVAGTVESGDQGTTFGGGMLAMAAVEATLKALVDEGLMARTREIEARVRTQVGPHVRAVRGRGCLLGLDLGRPARPVIRGLLDAGIIVGGADDPEVIRLMPPYVTPDEAIDHFAETLRDLLSPSP